MFNHQGTLRIETDKLILRRFEKSDAEDMFNNWASDDEVTKYLSWPTHTDIKVSNHVINDWTQSYKNDEFYHWAIELKNSGDVIGGITVVNHSNLNEHCEIGYCIGRDYWGQGNTTGALIAVIDFLFDKVGFQRVGALHHIENTASGKVMLKAGMKYEGLRRKYLKNKHGEIVDCESYAIISDDHE